jgi:hypothetical protein
MQSTSHEIFQVLKEHQWTTFVRKDLEKILAHRSIGALAGGLNRLTRTGVIVVASVRGNSYTYRVKSLDVDVRFIAGRQYQNHERGPDRVPRKCRLRDPDSRESRKFERKAWEMVPLSND